MSHTDPQIDVYPVGALTDLQWAARAVAHGLGVYRAHVVTPPGWPLAMVGRSVSSLRRHWRSRSYWNGYLAEPTPCPEGLRRIGHGWTKRRALRRLERNIAAIPESRA